MTTPLNVSGGRFSKAQLDYLQAIDQTGKGKKGTRAKTMIEVSGIGAGPWPSDPAVAPHPVGLPFLVLTDRGRAILRAYGRRVLPAVGSWPRAHEVEWRKRLVAAGKGRRGLSGGVRKVLPGDLLLGDVVVIWPGTLVERGSFGFVAGREISGRGVVADTPEHGNIWIRMDDFIPGAEEWDNEVVWSVEDPEWIEGLKLTVVDPVPADVDIRRRPDQVGAGPHRR